MYPVKTTTFDILRPFLAAFMMKLENFGYCKRAILRPCEMTITLSFIYSVADRLSRMRIFSIPEPNFPVPDPHQRI
jgi:hypothetical protein